MRKAWMAGLTAMALGACAGPADLTVDEAWVRLAAVPGRPAAAYFTVHGGPEATRLVAVSADYAIRAEMHESMAAGGGMTMKPIADVPVPAGEEVVFAPGGRHVMLFDMDPRAKPGTSTLLTLTFGDGGRLYRKAWIVAASAKAPD